MKDRKADPAISLEEIRTYLKKAQQTTRKDLIGRAYYMLAIKNSEIEIRQQFIDSAIYFMKDLKNLYPLIILI